MRTVVAPVFQSEFCQQLIKALVVLTSGKEGGQGNVFRNRQRGQQAEVLEDEANLVPAKSGAFPLGESLDRPAQHVQNVRAKRHDAAESGRLLGEIIVQNGLVSMVALVNALVEQLRAPQR